MDIISFRIILWFLIGLAIYIPFVWGLYDRDYPNKGTPEEGTMRILLGISGGLYILAGLSIYYKNIPFIYFFLFSSMIVELVVSFMMGPVTKISEDDMKLLKKFENASKEQLGISFDPDNYVEYDVLLSYNTYIPFLLKLLLLAYTSSFGVDFIPVSSAVKNLSGVR